MRSLTILVITLLVLNLTLPIAAYAQADNTYSAGSFADVPQNHWAVNDIIRMRELGLTDGVGNNMFGLGRQTRRSEFIKFLVTVMGWNLVSPAEGSYLDNKDSSKWFYSYIETAAANGAIDKDTQYVRPEDPVTREEMAVMIVKALGFSSLSSYFDKAPSPFRDVFSNKGYITLAKDFGIIAGYPDGLFKPGQTALREHVASMLMRLHSKVYSSLDRLHGFYAINSYGQRDMIRSFDSIAFGWSHLAYDKTSDSVIVSIDKNTNSDFSVPIGFEKPFGLASAAGVTKLLQVYASDHHLIEPGGNSGKVGILEYMLCSGDLRAKVVRDIAEKVNSFTADGVSIEFDGVLIDFESLKGEKLTNAFTEFLMELKEQLGAKKLYTAVHPKRAAGISYYDGYDYKDIGTISDKVIIMAHDYDAKRMTPEEMERGYTDTPPAPLYEVYYALKAATDKDTGIEDISKIMLQISFSTSQWQLSGGKVINSVPYTPDYERILNRLKNEDNMQELNVKYIESFGCPRITYFDPDRNISNVIWYEDSRSVAAKIELAKMFGINGLSLWRLGNIPDWPEQNYRGFHLDIWDIIQKYR